ncbi:hypothetical protein JW777_07985 [bacterium]|nr:hypothetical protein [bacterium]
MTIGKKADDRPYDMDIPLSIRLLRSGCHLIRFNRRLLFTRWVRGFK